MIRLPREARRVVPTTPNLGASLDQHGDLVLPGNWIDAQTHFLEQLVSPVIAVESLAESITITVGTATGTVANIYLENGIYYQVQETGGGSGGFDPYFTVRDTAKLSTFFVLHGYYTGNHNVKFRLWNWNSSTWVNVTAATTDMPLSTVPQKYVINLSGLANFPAQYFDASGYIRTQIFHDVPGLNTHYLYVDKFYLAREEHVPVLGVIDGTTVRGMLFPGTDTMLTAKNGTLELPHDWEEGSIIYPHIHWRPTTSSGGNVKWFMEFFWVEPFGTVTTSSTISNTVAAGSTAWQEKRTNFDDAGIDGAGKTIMSRLGFRVYRDPNDGADTYADAALVEDVQFHVKRDGFGSRQVTTK